MIIYVDTRQKKGKHDIKHSQLESLGHTLISKKLDCADYCSDNSNVVIDTKQDMDELYLDLFSEHARFAREIRLAQRQNKKLIILVEDDKIKVFLPELGKCVALLIVGLQGKAYEGLAG